MVNPGTSSFDLRKFPPDEKTRFVDSVVHGKKAMPPWGDILKPDEIEAIWAYVLTGGQTK
jgi:mono/diheme cytochrome c family protein